jgi:fumarate hydratase subunit beta
MGLLRYSAIEVKTLTSIHLKTPLSEIEVRRLDIGDTVYLSGTVVTARDQAYLRAIRETRRGRSILTDLREGAVYHCGPVMKKSDDTWSVVAAGPTTSYRMEEMSAEFMECFKVRMMIGKGGMGQKTSMGLKRFGAVYCDFTGGAALLAASAIKKVEGVEWLDLGVPEAMWKFAVENFGPLLVTMDSKGKDYRKNIG